MTAPEQCGAVFVSASAAGPAVQAGRRAPERSTLTGID